MNRASPGLADLQPGAEEKERTIGDALRELGDTLPRRADLLWLMTALDHYRRDDQHCRDIWDKHANVRLDAGRDALLEHDYWRRTWNMREKARRIIEGRQPWPAELLVWKLYKELRFSAGDECPAWLDAKNIRKRRPRPPIEERKRAALERYLQDHGGLA